MQKHVACRPSLATLVTAVKAAGLCHLYSFVEQRSGGGPFTVFAPTNDAFTKLSTQDLEVSDVFLVPCFKGL